MACGSRLLPVGDITSKILPPIILDVPARANAGVNPLKDTSKIGAF